MEIWRDIPWYEWLYKVSNLWNVKSLNYNHTWLEKILKSSKNWWYLKYTLFKDKKYKMLLWHRLVASAFLWLQLNNKYILACHINDIKDDNRVENLFIGGHKENSRDMTKKWKNYMSWKLWYNHINSKRVGMFDENMVLIKSFWSIREAERLYWYNSWFICKCCKWSISKAYSFIWKYL